MYLHTYLASFCDTSYSAIYELYLGLEVKKTKKKKTDVTMQKSDTYQICFHTKVAQLRFESVRL